MPEAQLYPHARWHPLGGQTQGRMRAHDLIMFHTMVGYLVSTDRYFRITNGIAYRGTESTYGVGGIWGPDLGGDLDGAVWQWQDRAFTADAALEGTSRAITVETADNAPQYPSQILAWTPKQMEANAQIAAWESTPAAHTACPPTWRCHQVGIPLVLVPNSIDGHRGVAYHRQGCDPYRVAGGERWSTSFGKVCPGDRRIAQIPVIIARARQIVAGTTTPPPAPQPEGDEDMQFIVNHQGIWLVKGDLSSRTGFSTMADIGAVQSAAKSAGREKDYPIVPLSPGQMARIPIAGMVKVDLSDEDLAQAAKLNAAEMAALS